jgi:hypothetical protein
MRIFGQLLLIDKQKVPYLYKTTSKEFEFFHKSYATAVAMATMTFQDAGYFGFKATFTLHSIFGTVPLFWFLDYLNR